MTAESLADAFLVCAPSDRNVWVDQHAHAITRATVEAIKRLSDTWVLSILDTANPYRTLEVRANAEIAPDLEYAFVKKLGARYGGVDLSTVICNRTTREDPTCSLNSPCRIALYADLCYHHLHRGSCGAAPMADDLLGTLKGTFHCPLSIAHRLVFTTNRDCLRSRGDSTDA